MTQKDASNGNALIDDVRRTLRGLVIATVILFIALAAVATYGYITSNQNRIAVCNLDKDLQRRVDSSKDFLIKHPRGLSQLGVTRAQIVKEITNQERTLDALSSVSC